MNRRERYDFLKLIDECEVIEYSTGLNPEKKMLIDKEELKSKIEGK